MNRLSVVAAKRAIVGATLALIALAAPRVAMAQDPDPLKFTSAKTTVIGWVVRADKTAEFEEAWAGIRAVLAKSDKADLKAFGDTLKDVWKVDAPIDHQTPQGAVKANIYLFRLETPSTTYSYNPREIIYVYLKAGQEGAPLTRPDADAIYAKLQASFLTISPLWTLTKIGG